MAVTLHHGDMLEVLPRLRAEGVVVQAVVTDAPYHLTSIVKRYGGESAAATKAGSAPNHTGAYARAARGFMGKQWDGGDIAFRAETWRLCWELLPPGGHLVAFSGSRTYHRMACAIEDAGFEIRDSFLDLVASDTAVVRFLASLTEEQQAAFAQCLAESPFGGMLAWLYGSGFPKSHDVSKGIDKHNGHVRPVVGVETISNDIRGGALLDVAHGTQRPAFERAITAAASAASAAWEGWGTALKPAFEPICVGRKPLDGTVAGNVLKYRTGALNIDGCRIEGVGNKTFTRIAGDRPRDQYRTGTAAPGSQRETDMGRWPANVVHDGSDEVVSAFPGAPGQLARTSTSTSTSTSTRKDQLVYGAMARGSDGREPRGDAGSAARFFYSSKADADDRLGSKHPTVKPVDLMRWLVRLVTPPGGTVLDPFAGSGTTGMACLAEGFNAILVEREAEYAADIRRRLAHVKGEDTPLFAGVATP